MGKEHVFMYSNRDGEYVAYVGMCLTFGMNEDGYK